jgi:hypothetical protein
VWLLKDTNSDFFFPVSNVRTLICLDFRHPFASTPAALAVQADANDQSRQPRDEAGISVQGWLLLLTGLLIG